MKKPTLPVVAAASVAFTSCMSPNAQTGVNDFLKRNESSPVSIGRFGVTRKEVTPATAAAPAEATAPATPAAPAAPTPASKAEVKKAPVQEAPEPEKPKTSFWSKKAAPSAEAPAAPVAPAPAAPEAPAPAPARKEKPKTTVKFSFWNKKESASAPAESAAPQVPAAPAAPAAPAPQEEKPQSASKFSFWKKSADSGEQKSTATKGSIGRFGYRPAQAAPPAAVAVQEAPPAKAKTTAKKSQSRTPEPAPFVEPLPERPQTADQKSGGPRLPNMLDLPQDKDLKTKGSAPKSGGDGVISKPPVEKKD